MGDRCFCPSDCGCHPWNARVNVCGCRGHACPECGESVAAGAGDDWWLEGVWWVARTHEGACSDARASRVSWVSS